MFWGISKLEKMYLCQSMRKQNPVLLVGILYDLGIILTLQYTLVNWITVLFPHHCDWTIMCQQTFSSPRHPLRYHYLVCSENYLFIIGIGPIRDKYLIFIFDMFLFFASLIEDRSKYYKINIRYTSVFNFFRM